MLAHDLSTLTALPLKRIGLLSDTHHTFDDPLKRFFNDVDEIWHAGDFGSLATADAIAAFKPLRGVYGNIDGGDTRRCYPAWQSFLCEEMRILMTHIGGYPGRYRPEAEEQIRLHRPDIFITGHSHILKVIFDTKRNHLHLNPGAAGLHGFHTVRTALRFTIDGQSIENLEVGEWKTSRIAY